MDLEQLSILNPRPERLPGPDLLHHLVAPASDLVALQHLHKRHVTSFSYREIHNLSDVLAGRLLLARGDVAGRFVVPVLVRQSPELYIALLAVLKAGGAFCPLNPDDPPDRIGFIVKDVAASVVVATEELAHRVPHHARVQVVRATAGDAAAAGSIEPPCHRRLPMPEPRGLAYVMYTSGSTGVPKGVGISHLAASQALLAHDARLPSFSRFLQFAAPTFDISVFEIFFTWHRGCTLVSADRDELLDDLPSVLRFMRVDACELTPTVAASLLRARDRAPDLKLLLTIGEMLNESVVREFGGDDIKESLLWAMYGPTEATIHCTLQPHFPCERSVHNIGTPLDTVSCFVIEPAQSPEQSHVFRVLPRGEIGELAVGGYQIAEEYLNRPDQTSTSFISTPHGRVYRTGDRSRLNPDGTLDCLGRLSDGQVKLRGQRLELGEVEAAILRAPGCHGAVAAVLNSSLVVFCAVDDGAVEEDILGHSKKWLPMYMVPGLLILLKEFPQLPSGKVDKKKLQRDYEIARSADAAAAAAVVIVAKEPDASKDLTEDDVKIFGVISQVLKVDVAKQTKLAHAGLDSLKAISLAATLRAAGFETNVAQLLALETVGDICFSARPKTETQSEEIRHHHLSRMKDLPQFITESPGLEHIKDLVDDILPCHPLQLAMLAATTQYHEAYWNDIEVEVEAGITVEQLSSAIHELIRQNEILRTGFVEHGDGFAAIVFKTFDPDLLELVDSFHGLDVSSSEALLYPLRLQILQEQHGGRGTRILLQIHHAIYDGWSMDIIFSDLLRLLSGSTAIPRPDFRRLIQYFYEIPIKQSDDDRAFWSEYLLGWKKQPFPMLRNRPAALHDIEICRESIQISPDIVDQATRKFDSSAQVFFQAALAMIWAGISGSPDLVIGSVLSGRTVPVAGIEGILGPCLASMPLRIDLARAKNLSDLLTSIKLSNRAIMEHSSLPLVQIKKLVRGLGIEAIYDVLFIYQQSLFSDQHEQNTIRETRHMDRLETKLLIEVEPARDGYRLQATFHTDAFDSEIVRQVLQQMKGAFIYLLGRELDTAPSLQYGTETQKSIFNDTPTMTAHELDLALLFEAAATKTPHADAIYFKTSFSAVDLADNTTTTSYEALNRLSNRIANRLLHQGARPGDVIAIFMEKSHLLYASILGIVKARCGYLPLLPSTPPSRVRGILLTSGVGMCIGDADSLNTLRSIEEVRYLEIDPDSLDSLPDHNPEITTDGSRLAYVMYTSGTTGAPKGVAVTQRNIVSNILHLGSTYPTAERNPPRLLQACSQAFDVSVFEIFFAWNMGMCLCAATNDALFEDIEHAIRQLRVTHLSLTPSAAALIDPSNVPYVEFLVTAGEPLTASVLDRWGDLLWQGYGPSETTNICSVKRMTRGEHVEHLGWVFPNTSVTVLKPKSHEVVPVGWVGELCFGGDQVAAGYLNMPDLTAEKFIHHPDLGRIYRSGDLGRMLPDGSLIILGRVDDQIKLRGQRIEAKEINSVITGTQMAVEAVTIPVSRGDVSSSDQLVSFYTTDRRDGEIETQETNPEVHHALFASLTGRLPAYEVPSYLVPVSRLPLTANSKIDRERLESCFTNIPHGYLEVGSRTTREQDDSEWTEIESSIADAISQTLEVPIVDIGRWTPFASLGLHSISAIGVARDLRTRLKARVPISAILQNPTVAQLGRFITAATTARNGAEETPRWYLSEASMDEIKKDFCDHGYQRVKIFPCSPLQEAMLSQGREAYYNRVTLRLRIRSDVMRKCWDEMVRRHDILRTCFVTTSDTRYPIAQVLLDHFDLPWRETNIQGVFLATAVRDHADTMLEPLSSKVPPFSLTVFQDKNESFLSLICHHALYDGVAMEILYREVEDLALGDSLPPPIPYQPFLQEMFNHPGGTERFWQDQLRRFAPPGIFTRPTHGRIVQSLHTTPLQLQYDEVQDKARSLGLSLLSLCQAAWAQVLSLCSKSTDVCFGCVVSGRTLDIVGLERLVAPCFNTVPVRKDISRHSNPLELAKALHRLNSSLIEYQFTPLRMIQNKIVGTEGAKLFDTLLILQLPHRELDGRIWSLEEDFGVMDLPIVCEIVPCPGSNSVNIHLHYHENVVDERTSVALADAFKHFFRSNLIQFPSDKDVLPPDALQLLVELAEGRTGNQREAAPSTDISDKESWTEIELQIRDALSELSGVPAQKIHRDTSIYRLGLDSINAVQIASMLRHQGRTVSASDVIEHQTCKKLAQYLLHNQTSSSGPRQQYDLSKFSESVMPQISAHLSGHAELEALLPCTPIQCAMLASFSQSGGEYYLNMFSFSIDDGTSKDQLKAGWKSLRSRHPMLKTGFVPIHHNDSSFAMVRYRDSKGKEFDGAQVQELAQTTDLADWKKAMASQIFGAMHLPTWRVAVSEGPSGLTIHVVILHALYDAQSLNSMMACLAGSSRGQTFSLFPSIEPALQRMLSGSIGPQPTSQEFWEEKAETTVVNKFPLMTPLRESERTILFHETTSTLAFSVLQRAARERGVTVQAVLQAAWTRILSSYLGEDSVVFGVVLSGRTLDETRDAPFPCMVTVPIVAEHQQSNEGLVTAMMEYNRELHKHQFTPLGQIQKWLGHPGARIFDTLLVYQKIDRDLAAPRLFCRLLRDDASVDYPVSIEVEPRDDDTIKLGITFFSDILPMEQSKLLLSQFDAIIEHLVMRPDGHADEAYRKAPGIFSITPASVDAIPAPVTFLHQFVEERALSHPNDPALEFVSGFDGEAPISQTWTYEDLNSLGNRVANMLKSEASVGSIIAIHFEKCPEAYVSILGILKAGCSFVALDVGAPKSRKEYIINDSQAPCLLVSSHAAIEMETTCKVIRIGLDELHRHSPEPRDLGPEFAPEATCYCLYTSGTTGLPKGCEITHANCVQAMMAFQDLFKGHWQSDSRWLQFAALHFDVSVLEQYWSWSVGITVVAASRDLILDDLIGSINRLSITHIDLTPSLARLTHPDDVPGLCKGVFITGGEALKQEILDDWGPKEVIYNAYGPTEATIGVTMYQRVPVNGRPSNIGKQFLNVGSYVFQRATEIPVLRGGVGELCVSGKLVGKGYLNRPELTEERFPMLREFDDRIYRTGDLVRIFHDGSFEFLGRADDQVKLRGQRLEIGEINHVIRTEAPDVIDVATLVMQRDEASQKDILVSFLVGQQTQEKGRAALDVLLQGHEDLVNKAREACRAKLPSYMVPSYFLVLPYIPLSPNNKVEAKELKRLFEELSAEQLLALMAGTLSSRQMDAELTRRTIEILAEFCHVDASSITATTSIFDLGVDSIVALQLSTFFKSRGLGSCTPVLLLLNPIIADLSFAISNQASSTKIKSLVRESKQIIRATHHRHLALACHALGVMPRDVGYLAPCSALQQGIISKSVTSQVRGLYFNNFELELAADTSVERLASAWSGLIADEAIFRTRFVKTVDGYVQVALKGQDCLAYWREREVGDEQGFRAATEAARQEWVERNLEDDNIKHPFEVWLVRGPSKTKLMIHIFHALYDGNSFDLMMRQVEERYHHADGLWSLGPSFLDALCHGPLWRHDECREFWRAHLRQWQPSPLPLLSESERSAGVDGNASSLMGFIDGKMLEAVRKKHNVTLQSVVMALWAVVLQELLNSRDGVSIGVIVSGRSINLANAENTIGPLFNTLPFFHTSASGPSWTSVIRTCHDFNTSILPFQHVPLKHIQRWCSGGRPLFDNVFVFMVEQGNAISPPDLWIDKGGPLNPDYPLALEVTKLRNGDLKLYLVSQSQVADVARLEDILQKLEKGAGMMVAETPLYSDANAESKDQHPQESSDSAVAVNGQETPDEFIWNDQAIAIRNAVAAVADISLEDITATRTMLEFGLDSVDIIQLSAKLRSQGVSLPASAMMRLQTISRMSTELITQSHRSGPSRGGEDVEDRDFEELTQTLRRYAESQECIEPGNIEAVLPPTSLQESMVAGMVHSNFEWYFNHDLMEVASDLDLAKLQSAWDQLVMKSPILRTGFLEVDDPRLDMGYCQLVYKERAAVIQELEIQSLSEVRQIMQSATEDARERHGRDGLFQLRCVECQGRRFFLVSMAHALFDGWSLGLTYHDLEVAYHGELKQRATPQTFIQRLLASQTDDDARFWTGYLDGASRSLIPLISQQDPADDALYRREEVSEIPLAEISEFCKKRNVSLQTLVQACWATVLAQRTGSLDVVFGVVLSGRDFEGAEDLMFPTMNTVLLRCILHGTSTEFLEYLEAVMMDVRDHQSYPLRKVQTSARLPVSGQFNTLCILQKAVFGERLSKPLLRSVDGSSAVEYPVCIEAEATRDGLVWRVACQGQFMTEDGTSQLVRDLDHVLAFVTRSEAAALLSFHGEEVSICGLPRVVLSSADLSETKSVTAEAASSESLSEKEIAVRRCLSRVANIAEDSIPTHVSLYHLGLDSISALKVCSFLRREGYHINPRDLLKATSVPQMAAAIRRFSDSGDGQKIPSAESSELWKMPWSTDVDVETLLVDAGISRQDVELLLPALPMQAYMISAWLNSQGAVFFPEFRYSIDGPSDVVNLDGVKLAWESLVAELPILRTIILPTRSLKLPFFQVVFKSIKGAVADANPRPMVDFCVSRPLGGQGGVQVRLRIHHALYDGVSLPAMMRRLLVILQEQGNKPATIQDIQQWSVLAKQPNEQRARQARKSFWMEYLREVRPASSGKHITPETGAEIGTTTRQARVSYLKRAAVGDLRGLRALTSRHGVSLQALFLAAYAKTLSAHGGGGDIVFGVYLASRLGAEDLPTTLPTLNLVPLRARAAAACRDARLADVAWQIQDDIHAIGSGARARVGLWEIAHWTGITVDSFVNFFNGIERLEEGGSGGVRATLAERGGDDEETEEEEEEEEEEDYRYSARAWERFRGVSAVGECFPPAIDVEAAVKDGALDVGVFGSRRRISDDAAAALVDDIVGYLSAAASEA